MYIRFETNLMFTGTPYKKGIFAAMGNLKRMGVMTAKEGIWYQETAAWFNDNLANPTCFDIPVSDDIKFIANSWFIDSPSEYLVKSYKVIALLEKYGIEVYIKRSKKPGRVIYSDRLQVVAIPETR